MRYEAGYYGDTVQNKKGCWYFIYVTTCPVCGKSREERVRVKTEFEPRPENWEDRHQFEENWDGCQY